MHDLPQGFISIYLLTSAEALVIWMLSSLPLAGLIAAITWIGSRAFRHPRFWHVVWLLILAKLFLPLAWTLQTRASLSLPVNSSEQGDLHDTALLDPSALVSVAKQESRPTSPPIQDAIQSELIDRRSSSESSVSQFPKLYFSWSHAAVLIWALGSVALLAHLVRHSRRLNRLIRQTQMDPDDPTREEFDAMMESVESNRTAKVLFGNAVLPPMLWSFGFSTALYIPAALWSELDDSGRRLVLLHETIHLKRRDDQVRWIVALACVLLWWNPLVWLAAREIRWLEEEACDATIRNLRRDQVRTYASVLIQTVDFLSTECSGRRIGGSKLSRSMSPAVSMTDETEFRNLTRRITMLSKPVSLKWHARHFAVVALVLVTPLCFRIRRSIAEDADRPTVTTVSGTLTDRKGNPISDAVVTLAYPKADLRFMDEIADDVKVLMTRTDDNGHYQIDIDSLKGSTSASIDFARPNFKRLVGTQMAGGAPNTLTLEAGETTKFDAQLESAWYVAGTVVDEAGEPIPGVVVSATYCGKSFCAGVSHVMTNDHGEFEVFGYQDELFHSPEISDANRDDLYANLSFAKRGFMDGKIRDIHKLNKSSRADLKATLKRGLIYEGQLLTPGNNPAAGRLISLQNVNQYQYNGAITDQQGRFKVVGLAPGKTKVTVCDFANSAAFENQIDLQRSLQEQTISLTHVDTRPTKVVEVAGMKLGELSPDLAKSYHIPEWLTGAIVIDPGPESEAFEIGALEPGFVFFTAGNTKVKNLEEFIRVLAGEATKPSVPPGEPGNTSAIPFPDGKIAVRVVYSFANEESQGTNTQYMKLNQKQVEELKEVVSRMKARKP